MTKKTHQTAPLSWDYAPSPESTSHIQLKEKYDLYINGKWVKPSSGKYFDTINPATEEKLSEIAEASDSDVDKAVKAARKAYKNVWIKHEDIVKGGALEYVMGSKPSKWGLKTNPVPYADGSVD